MLFHNRYELEPIDLRDARTRRWMPTEKAAMKHRIGNHAFYYGLLELRRIRVRALASSGNASSDGYLAPHQLYMTSVGPREYLAHALSAGELSCSLTTTSTISRTRFSSQPTWLSYLPLCVPHERLCCCHCCSVPVGILCVDSRSRVADLPYSRYLAQRQGYLASFTLWAVYAHDITRLGLLTLPPRRAIHAWGPAFLHRVSQIVDATKCMGGYVFGLRYAFRSFLSLPIDLPN